MASVSSPYGVQVISDQGGPAARPNRQVAGIANGLAQNIFKGQPCKLVNGLIQPCTNNNGVPDPIFCIFDGVDFTPLGGRPTESPFWASGTQVNTNEDFLVYYFPVWMPGYRLRIQADGSVAQALMGSGFNLTNPTAGNTFTGQSQATVGAAGVPAGSQAQFALTEFYDTQVLDTIGDAFTDLICTIAYPQVGFRGQNSIG